MMPGVIAIIVLVLIVLCVFLFKFVLRLFVRKCESDVLMTGKVVIVTGANSGIGFETAINLSARGARVILACRNEKRGKIAEDKIFTESRNPDVVYKNLDLSSLDSIRKFAGDINRTESRLDVLINNAGMFGGCNKMTPDGIIECMQVNYFGPFLLTLLLLPLLKKSAPSRIINVSSIMAMLGQVNLDRINTIDYYSICYRDIRTYSDSKLFSLLFTMELSDRLQGSEVTVNALHPGIINTNLTSNSNILKQTLFKLVCWLCKRSTEEGAQTVIYLAVAENLSNVSGKFFADCKEQYMWWCARNKTLRANLWPYSEKLVGYKMNESYDSPTNLSVE